MTLLDKKSKKDEVEIEVKIEDGIAKIRVKIDEDEKILDEEKSEDMDKIKQKIIDETGLTENQILGIIEFEKADKISDLEKRFRELLCKKIYDTEIPIALVDFCKLPGYRIAREGNAWVKKINQHVKKKDNMWIENVNSRVTKKYNQYNADVHLVESCTRHLMRKKAETMLGKTQFILTSYSGQYLCEYCKDNDKHSVLSKTGDKSKLECVVCRNSYDVASLKPKNQVSRFGKPIGEDFMLYFVVEKSDNSNHTPPIIFELQRVVREFEKFKNENKDLFAKLESSYSVKKKDLNGFENLNGFKKSLKDRVLKKAFEIHYELQDKNTSKKVYPVRWTAWALNSGRHSHTYTPREGKMILTSLDQQEHIMDALTRNIMRENLQPFFGHVSYTLSVFKKIARISMRLDDENTLFVSLDDENTPFVSLDKEISKKQPVYTPPIITKLDEFLGEFNWEALDTISIT